MTTCTGRDAGVSWERAGWPSERDEGENAIEWDERRRESPNRVAPGPPSYESSCNKHARRKRISLEARRAGRARHAARRARSPRRITSWPGQRGRVNIHSLWIGPVGRCPHLPARRLAMRALAPSVPAHLAARRAVHSPRLGARAPATSRPRASSRRSPSASALNERIVQDATAAFAIPGSVRFELGEGGLPKCADAQERWKRGGVPLARVTSWCQPSGDDVLYVRPDAVFDKSKPISGGISLCFPVRPERGYAARVPGTD